MSTKPNYFKIGLFIIIAITLLVITVVIWGAGLFKKDKIYYETYFDSSVAGLAPGSSVLLMGVKIGQIESIELATASYNLITDPNKVSKYERYVRVVCSMEGAEAKKRVGIITQKQRESRIKDMVQQGLRLRLASNLLTGQGYLEGLFLDPKRFPPLDINWKPQYLYVPSTPGAFSTITDSVDKIMVKLEEVDIAGLGKEIQGLFTELRGTNKQIQTKLDEVDAAGLGQEIKGLFAELRGTNKQLQELLTNPDPNAERTNIAQIMIQLENTLEEFNLKIRSEGPEIEKFLNNIRAISDDVKELTAMLKRHPSEIIFSQPPAKSEIVK